MQAQAAQMQMQQEMAAAELREKTAKAAKAEAEADRVQAETINVKMTATGTAMTAAQAVIHMPTIAKVADSLLTEAGWKGYNAPAVQGLPPVQPAAPTSMVQPDAASGGAAEAMPA